MEVRTLGASGLISSAIGLGCLGFTGGYGAVDEVEAVATIWQALDTGVTLLDVADLYGGGSVERLVGQALQGRRAEAVIATRGGATFTPQGRPTGLDCRPQRLHEACDASLRRLGVDQIDLYYLARVDPAVPVEESVGALSELVAAGKVRHVGVCEVTPEQLRRAHAVHPLAVVAAEYSLIERSVEAELLPTAREMGVGLVACSPLARGLLTGRLSTTEQLGPGDYRHNHPRFAPENLDHNYRLIRAAEQLAADRQVSLSRLALAWVLAQGKDIVAIPGTRTRTHLEMNVAATQIELCADESAALAAAVPAGEVAGAKEPRRR